MTLSIDALLNILEKGGLFAVCVGLAYAVYALVNGKVVVRPWHEDIVTELRNQIKILRDDNRILSQLAHRGTELAEHATKEAISVAPRS